MTVIAEEIQKLKIRHDAVILAHYYQLPEIQEIADYVGDSFALSSIAAGLQNAVVVVCGVKFIAESVKVLSPQKMVLLPAADAGCPMADMITADRLNELKKLHPDAAVVAYVNSSYEVKALSDICCTSSNAVKVVRSLAQERILFVPDENLGSYIAEQVPEKQIVSYSGYCAPHKNVDAADVLKAKEKFPAYELLVHPECKAEVRELADFIGSTDQIIKYAGRSKPEGFLIGTEMGVLFPLKMKYPEKHFQLLADCLFCADMKKIRLGDLYNSLNGLKYQVLLDEVISEKAAIALQRMLDVS